MAYIPEDHPSEDAQAETRASSGDTDTDVLAETPASSIPSAFPFVQPAKAALYFDSADGFGDWRILISTRADRNLREAKKKDKNTFRIILKKIK